MNQLKLRQQLEQFFMEDIGDRDLTTDIIFPKKQKGEIIFLSKASGIFCGTDIIEQGFLILDNSIKIQLHVEDGQKLEPGQPIATVSGAVVHLLKGERVILNLIQRMSGIATITNKAVEALNSGYTKICDTRKTTPGLRMLEKYAVTVGGGFNHRFGLYDAVMIKDNHIAFAGSITEAVRAVKNSIGHMVKVEVETESFAQMTEALAAGADVIMFDNRTPAEIADWITHVPETVTTEASGGITLANLASYKDCGVDYISLGFLTHSAQALDISVQVKLD
ncbi:carboxylating nicotinate-nucleotide diphosphorylase [Paenibacillus alvei]